MRSSASSLISRVPWRPIRAGRKRSTPSSPPHMYSVPLREIADLILRLKAQCLSIEAAKPNHTHEWKVWREVKIPDGKIFMPGVIDHTTDVREHPEVIADRIINYANVVGR